jgi:hypothetical protein
MGRACGAEPSVRNGRVASSLCVLRVVSMTRGLGGTMLRWSMLMLRMVWLSVARAGCTMRLVGELLLVLRISVMGIRRLWRSISTTHVLYYIRLVVCHVFTSLGTHYSGEGVEHRLVDHTDSAEACIQAADPAVSLGASS